MPSRVFGNRSGVRSHLLNAGGLANELLDLRADIEAAFLQDQTDKAGAAAPVTPYLGQHYYNSTTGISFVWNGVAWSPVGPPTFVYRPGGTAGGGIFTNFLGAYAAAAATGRPTKLVVDDSLSPGSAVTGNAGALDFSLIALESANLGYSASFGTPLTFQTGTTVSNWSVVRGVSCQSTSTAPITTIGSVAGQSMSIWMDRAIFKGGSLAQFFDIQNPGGGNGANFISWFMTNWSFLLHGTNPAVHVAAGAVTYALPYIWGGGSGYDSTAFAGPGNVYTVCMSAGAENGSSGALPTTMTPVTSVGGTYAIEFDSRASQLGYTVGTSANWAGTAPTTTSAALDRMAALLKTLNSNTAIP